MLCFLRRHLQGIFPSPCPSKDTFMAKLQQKFPKVFEPLKHSVVAKVETVTETPVWSRFRRLASDKLAALRLKINRLINNGILAKSLSEWSSPIVMVKKANGQYRLCANFVSLNKVLKKTRYPLPIIHELSVMSSCCSIFSCIDIVDAYYQIPVDTSCSRELTTTNPIDCYRYLYLPWDWPLLTIISNLWCPRFFRIFQVSSFILMTFF